MSKRTTEGDVMNYNAIVMRGCERPKQLEIAGADDFNLIGETVQGRTATPSPDEATGDLFAAGPIDAWVAQSRGEREAVEAKRREADARAEAIRADLAKPR
jgi:hypothetical protein